MITYMSDIMVVTNRHLCRDDFLLRMERIAQAHPAGIILREKDLEEMAYKELAGYVLDICKKYGTMCILHNFVTCALELHSSAIHLPMDVLRTLPKEQKERFTVLGASCHSVEEAREAEILGCTYITAGHIFDTSCKKGLPGRGISFLRQVCSCTSVPVYAIGGISVRNLREVRNTKAAGGCVMSGAMVCEDVPGYIGAFEKKDYDFS